MSHPFEHPASERLLERVASHFNGRPIFLLPQNQLAFVCGGPDNDVSTRSKFLKWARANLSNFHFFLAEAAAKDIISEPIPKFLNLATFERVLADVADVVIIFPESVGSWAEIGFFSALPKFQKKCLVVNSAAEQGDSFLNVGPIQILSEKSIYKPTVYVDVRDEQIDFAAVAEKLKRYATKRRSRFAVNDFNRMTGQQQLAFVLYLIQIFPSLNLDSILVLFKKIGFKYRKLELPRSCPYLSAPTISIARVLMRHCLLRIDILAHCFKLRVLAKRDYWQSISSISSNMRWGLFQEKRRQIAKRFNR